MRDRFNREVADASCTGVHYRDVIGVNGSVRVEKVETPSPVGGLALSAPETVKPGEPLAVKAAWTTACDRVKAAVFETVAEPTQAGRRPDVVATDGLSVWIFELKKESRRTRD